jgi:iron complex outermembrane receptor protein
MNPRCTLAAGALALAAAYPAAAATPNADQPTETIIVTATRFDEADPKVAANVSVITRQEIRNTAAPNLPDLLATRAGISVIELTGGPLGRNATVDMRGFPSTATSNTLILVDGLRINPLDSGTIPWSSIPLESIERIEIIRGSGTVLYGDGATGGVINIVTNKSGKPVAAATASVGSYGYRSADVQLANGNDKAYYNIVGNYATTDGYRQNSQQDQSAASGRVGWLLDRGEVFADFAAYKESAGLTGAIFSQAYHDDPRSTRFPHDFEERNGYRIRPGVSYAINDRLTFQAEVAHEYQDLDSHFISSNSASERKRDTTSFTPRLRWRHDLGALTSETVFGYDYYDGDFDADNFGFANQGASQRSSAVYAQNITHLTDTLSLTLGGRNQRMQQKAHQDAYAPFFSPAISGESTRTRGAYDVGLAYAVDSWRVYGKSGTTFRFANLDELFGFDPVSFSPVFAGDLKPQHGTINEVGGSVALGRVNFRGSIYRLDLEDEIGFDSLTFANVNLDPTRRDGAEIEADWKIVDSLQAKASYAFTDATFRSGANAGKAIPLVARHQATAQLAWNTGRTGLYSAFVRYVGERPYSGDVANAHEMLSSYTTLDLQAAWDLKPLKITAKVLNATNRKYSPFAGISGGDTFYYPADGRAGYLAARYDF